MSTIGTGTRNRLSLAMKRGARPIRHVATATMTGSISLQFSAELTARYIAQWIARFRDGTLRTVEVTEEATAQFSDGVREAMAPTVWNTGCNSWYLTEGGAVDLWPYDRAAMTAMLSTVEEGHFHRSV